MKPEKPTMHHSPSMTSFPSIENHGIIGDLHTVALVATDGAIDFMCFPAFDSPTIFASLLDPEHGGHFRIDPLHEAERRTQFYLPDSNILLTRFYSDDGVVELSDLMPVEEQNHAHRLIRRIKMVHGTARFRMVCAPKFDYGRAGHKVVRHGEQEFLFVAEGPHKMTLRLRGSIPMHVRNGSVTAEFRLATEEHASFILEDAELDTPTGQVDDHEVSEAFKHTLNFWREWVGRSTYRGRWREMVTRSALTLKLLTYRPSGALVAAPTFGLPEEIGGSRNWDYRHTWIRDATFTIYAFLRLGYTEEAAAFMHWIEERCTAQEWDGSLQVVYGIRGHKELQEAELKHWQGYRGSSPVRIGNDAYLQLQLDLYGALMDAVYLYNKYGTPISYDLWHHLARLLDWVCENWRQTGQGIWEVRGETQEWLSSRLMCWVALDRGIRLAQKRSFPAPTDRWVHERDAIFSEIMTEFWDAERATFTQYKHGRSLDASCLLMPLVKFIGPTDPRWLSTMKAVEQHLVEDSLVYRYDGLARKNDGLAGGEGTFSLCSFWYVECLSRAGDLHKARLIFEKMLGYANHLGLYAEELGRSNNHLGNFPQAFTHLALISAAYDLNRRLEGGNQ
ncbi:MAG: glycoside hydrolase family 15 protein [Nitrospira sp.]|nr:glycoside hydrolase family 15 protein [Nitrospira sp.]